MRRIRCGQIVDAISIRERPADVAGTELPPAIERTIRSAASTKSNRHSARFALLIKVPSKDTVAVVAALGQHVRKLPATLRRSLTGNRGLEMAEHKTFTVATDVGLLL